MNRKVTRKPSQTRAMRTVERILDAAARLLAEKGFEGMNTNAVAADAGVNIATLYNYFPDKQALLQELLARYNARQMERARAIVAENPDRQARVDVIIEALVALQTSEPWIPALRKTLAASPALSELREQANQHMVDLVIEQIPPRQAGPRLSGDQQQVVLRLLVETFQFAAQTVSEAPQSMRPAMLAETKKLLNAYLDSYR